jgi:predicted peroxiredoxin
MQEKFHTTGKGLHVKLIISMEALSLIQITNRGNLILRIRYVTDDSSSSSAVASADKGWGSVHTWITLEGADLAPKSKVERIESPVFKKFGNALELMKKLKEKGAWFGVCPPCADYFAANDKLDFVEKAGGDWLMKNIQEAWVVWM